MAQSRSKWMKHQEKLEELRIKRDRERSRKKRAKNRRLQEARFQSACSLQSSSPSESYGFRDSVSGKADFGMAVARDARELAYTVNELTAGRGLEYQRAVLLKLLEQPLLRPALPEAVVKMDEREHCRVVCNGIAEAWSALKYGVGRDRYMARNVIEAAVVDVKDARAATAASRCIGMNRRTLRRAIARRRMLNVREQGVLWSKCDRKKRRDALSQEAVDAVVSWWTEETRVSPSKKDIRRKRMGVRQYISHAGHWLEESQV